MLNVSNIVYTAVIFPERGRGGDMGHVSTEERRTKAVRHARLLLDHALVQQKNSTLNSVYLLFISRRTRTFILYVASGVRVGVLCSSEKFRPPFSYEVPSSRELTADYGKREGPFA
jgi:hypothetical protein